MRGCSAALPAAPADSAGTYLSCRLVQSTMWAGHHAARATPVVTAVGKGLGHPSAHLHASCRCGDNADGGRLAHPLACGLSCGLPHRRQPAALPLDYVICAQFLTGRRQRERHGREGARQPSRRAHRAVACRSPAAVRTLTPGGCYLFTSESAYPCLCCAAECHAARRRCWAGRARAAERGQLSLAGRRRPGSRTPSTATPARGQLPRQQPIIIAAAAMDGADGLSRAERAADGYRPLRLRQQPQLLVRLRRNQRALGGKASRPTDVPQQRPCVKAAHHVRHTSAIINGFHIILQGAAHLGVLQPGEQAQAECIRGQRAQRLRPEPGLALAAVLQSRIDGHRRIEDAQDVPATPLRLRLRRRDLWHCWNGEQGSTVPIHWHSARAQEDSSLLVLPHM